MKVLVKNNQSLNASVGAIALQKKILVFTPDPDSDDDVIIFQ